MLRTLIIALILPFALLLSSANAQTPLPGTQYVSIGFHDVVDDPGALTDDAITTDNLVAFFEWLRGNNWTAVSLNDIALARAGGKPLPPRAILLTFDDGYRSMYTRVFPLLLAYRMPAVSALVGAWMDAPMDAQVRYVDTLVPRANFLSWAEAREMQSTGLVEFASHSYDLHRGILGNPQGNTMPSAVTLEFRGTGEYENADAHRQRLETDARRIRDLFARELGRAPRAWVWPYGRYSAAGIEAIKSAGFEFAMTLDAGPADARNPLVIPRQYPGADAKLADLVAMIRLERRLPTIQRLVCLDPAALWSGDYATTDARLGNAIERLRTLGATAVVIDAITPDSAGGASQAWFPNSQLPVRADLLSRLVWQLQTRAGVDAYVRLPVAAAQQTLKDAERVSALFRDLGAQIPLAGLFVDEAAAAGLAHANPQPGTFRGRLWETRASRDTLDLATLGTRERQVMQAFREMQRYRPWITLALLVDPLPGPADGITVPVRAGALPDLVLTRSNTDVYTAQTLNALTTTTAEAKARLAADRRSGLWFAAPEPPTVSSLSKAVRRFQLLGGTASGWCPDDPVSDLPSAAAAAPAVSASDFPVKF